MGKPNARDILRRLISGKKMPTAYEVAWLCRMATVGETAKKLSEWMTDDMFDLDASGDYTRFQKALKASEE
jgi:hypothetical protein